MIDNLLLLNKLKPVDVGFFIACAVIVVLIVAVYFLIPVFNKKQYEEQRENLKKREAAFKANKNGGNVETVSETEVESEISDVDSFVIDTDSVNVSEVSDNELDVQSFAVDSDNDVAKDGDSVVDENNAVASETSSEEVDGEQVDNSDDNR